jgi:hypothetical protein
MRTVLTAWRETDLRHGTGTAARWSALRDLADPATSDHDLYTVAQRWLELARPTLSDYTHTSRNPLPRLRDITHQMTHHPVPLPQVEEHFTGLAPTTPAENRITAGILGIPHQYGDPRGP